MKINKQTFIIYACLATAGLLLWSQFTYPQLSFVKLKVEREEARQIAKNYLSANGVNPKEFLSALMYTTDSKANQYLQKTIGFHGLKKFIRDNDFDMFLWIVRFFKEDQKEEYRFSISSATGQITSYKHSIEETDYRKETTKEAAQEKALLFLKEKFSFTPDKYTLKSDITTKKDNRTDYTFSWQKNSVSIPWTQDEKGGTAKLSTTIIISGDEILSFTKNLFDIPEPYTRSLEKQQNTASNITTIVKTLYLALYVASIFFLILRRNHLAMHTTKKFYIYIMFISMLLAMAEHFNYFEEYLMSYNTAGPLKDYLWRLMVNITRSALIVSVGIIIPSLAGELLHFESFKDRKEGAFLHYFRSSLFSRNAAKAIIFGYLGCLALLGIQAAVIEFGQRHLGVWVEYNIMDQLSTAYWPLLAAFTIGFQASFTEEIVYRLFSMSLFKKIFKNLFLALLFSSLIWGFAHSNYPVYPMWFRGLEVSCLGLFIGYIYLRFGIITALVSHFLFDVFWGTSIYLLSQTYSNNFYYSLLVLSLPLIYAITAFICNGKTDEKPLVWMLNKHQKHNLEILKTFLLTNKDKYKGQTKEQIIKEIASHGWDIAVVEVALEEIS